MLFARLESAHVIRSTRLGSCYSLKSSQPDLTRLSIRARYRSSITIIKIKMALTCPGARLPSNNCGDVTFGTYVLKLNACPESLAPLVLLQRCACSTTLFATLDWRY
jgi:hypothetical protein